MSGGREWAMTLDVVCRVEACANRDTATVAGRGALDATDGARKVLRYRGWRLDRRDDLCPDHAGPIPVCELCGEPTPKPYGSTHGQHYTGVSFACHPCGRAALKRSVLDRQFELANSTPPPPEEG